MRQSFENMALCSVFFSRSQPEVIGRCIILYIELNILEQVNTVIHHVYPQKDLCSSKSLWVTVTVTLFFQSQFSQNETLILKCTLNYIPQNSASHTIMKTLEILFKGTPTFSFVEYHNFTEMDS